MPQFSPSDLFLPLVGLIKNTQLAKSIRQSPWIFSAIENKTKEKTCVKHEEPQGGFFLCRNVPPLLWTLYRRRLSTPFPTVQGNNFSRLRDPIRNTKKYDKCHFLQLFRWAYKRGGCVFCALRDGHLEVWALAQRCNSFITCLSYFVYMCSNMSKSARFLYDINASFQNLQ